MIDSYILKNSLPAMNNYELFAIIGMVQQELCDRHMKNHDNCQYCPVSWHVCHALYERMDFLVATEEREIEEEK